LYVQAFFSIFFSFLEESPSIALKEMQRKYKNPGNSGKIAEGVLARTKYPELQKGVLYATR
jgi:hypothetical protein